MSTNILLMRHGETSWNREKRFRGVYDIPLNENGRAQARLLARVLQTRAVDIAYTSPLKRAQETAEIVIGNRQIDVEIENSLIDIDYGAWTGLDEAEVAQRWPDEYELWCTRPHMLQIPEGSTLKEVFDRSFEAMDEISSKHNEQTVALFAHRVVNKLLVLGVLGLTLERFPFIRQDNCCLNEFERNDFGYVIHTINNTSYVNNSHIDILSIDF